MTRWVGLPIAALNGGLPAIVVSSIGAGIGWVARRSASF